MASAGQRPIGDVPDSCALIGRFEFVYVTCQLVSCVVCCWWFRILRSGLIYAVRQTLRLVPSGLVFLGVPCSMLVWISSGTHGRAAPNFMGDSSIPGVVASNTLLARASLLCCLAMARSVFWAVEQPGSSCLPKTPYWRRLLVLKIKRMHFIRLPETQVPWFPERFQFLASTSLFTDWVIWEPTSTCPGNSPWCLGRGALLRP